MKTYQDLEAASVSERERSSFILAAIREHEASAAVRMAALAADYFAGHNTTIERYNRILYNLAGQPRIDRWSPNHKIACHYYRYFVVQEALYLLGNGVSFNDEKTKEKLGEDFDRQIVKAAIEALNAGEVYGFWDAGRLVIFPIFDALTKAVFVPLLDEDTGAIRAGIRKWQLAEKKPMRCTLYEEDGFTEFVQRPGEDLQILADKRPYRQIVSISSATGETLVGGENYNTLPIVPLYNFGRQSALDGNRDVVDALDLMMSGLVNNVDDGALIYWVIQNAGGMDDADDQRFIERLRTLHVAHTEGEERVDAHTINVPFEASSAAIEALKSQLFDNFMALDVKKIASGAATATEIKAAYEPLNSKTDLFELQVTEFIRRIIKLAGIDDKPSYTRSMVVNQQEAAQTLVMSAQNLSGEYVTRKLLEIFGDIDKAQDVLDQIAGESMTRYNLIESEA